MLSWLCELSRNNIEITPKWKTSCFAQRWFTHWANKLLINKHEHLFSSSVLMNLKLYYFEYVWFRCNFGVKLIPFRKWLKSRLNFWNKPWGTFINIVARFLEDSSREPVVIWTWFENPQWFLCWNLIPVMKYYKGGGLIRLVLRGEALGHDEDLIKHQNGAPLIEYWWC